jgi:argininosuccinate synthase
MLSMTVTPEKAPNKPEYIEIEFEKGIPVSLNGKKMEGVQLINALNKIGGANGIGIIDLVENRVVGMKSRGVYETPGGTILYYAHQELEHLCLDRQTYSFKQQVSLKLSELIYGGLWFTPLREALCAFVDSTQQTVSGKARLKLYKGSINAAGVTSANSLYNTSLASFTTGELFNHADAKGFIKLYGLPVLVRSLMEQEKKGDVKASGTKVSSSGKTATGKPKSATGKSRTAVKK